MKNRQNNSDQKIQEIWDSAFPNVPEKDIEESWKMFSSRVKSRSRRKAKRNFIRTGSVAAVMLVLLSAYFYETVYNPVITATNLSLVEKRISLPDGSLVFLQKGASIKYKEHFRDSRGVKLKGSAFFDVAEDSLKVFSITTGATTIKVLGTTFYVNRMEGPENVKVSLFTGDVLVSIKNKPESWNIDPGEEFVYHNGKTRIEKFNVKLNFRHGNDFIDVNHVSIKKLYEFLGARFGYSFVVQDDLENKAVTLKINKSDPLKKILKVLSIISNTTYEINKETKRVHVFNK